MCVFLGTRALHFVGVGTCDHTFGFFDGALGCLLPRGPDGHIVAQKKASRLSYNDSVRFPHLRPNSQQLMSAETLKIHPI